MISKDIIAELKKQGVDFIRFVDVSRMHQEQNKGLPNAVLFGIALSPEYVRKVADTPNYVRIMIDNNRNFENDEFYLTELRTGELSDHIAQMLISEGYKAYSQSDKNQIATNHFEEIYFKTPLPHKTIAVMAGIGWIGRNNLLVTPEYGCALCIGAILTDAQLSCEESQIIKSKCGICRICLDVCDVCAIKGYNWSKDVTREDMIDVYKCTTCMRCLVHCRYSQNYVRSLVQNE